jgi:hypothetical protein
MAEGKIVTIYAPGRTTSNAVAIMPDDTVDMIITKAIADFRLPPVGPQLFYQLTKDGIVLIGNLYKSVQSNDELDMQRVEKGGCALMTWRVLPNRVLRSTSSCLPPDEQRMLSCKGIANTPTN